LEHCLEIISALKRNETNFNIQSQLTDAYNEIQGLCCKAVVGSRPTATKVLGFSRLLCIEMRTPCSLAEI
jgi:hypothetical protein